MGLLDFLNSAEAQTGLGLLAAAGPRSDGAGFGQRLLEGLSQGDRWKAQQAAAKRAEMQDQMQQMQMAQAQAQLQQQQKMQGLASQFTRPGVGMAADGYGPSAPASFDRQGYGAALEGIDPIAGMQYMQSIQKQAPKLTAYKPGDSVRDDSGREVFSVPKEAKEPDLPSAVREYQFAQGQGYKGSFVDFQNAQKKAGASNINVPINLGQKGFDNTLKLRGDFRSEPIYKAHQEVQSAYSQVQQSLKMASPVGDLAGATKIMKLLDPGSVVRESELGMAMAASGAMDRLTNYAGNVMNGTKLTPTQRKDFQALADALYKESANQYNGKREEYKGIADRNQLNVQDVLGSESNKSPATKRYNEKTEKMEAM